MRRRTLVAFGAAIGLVGAAVLPGPSQAVPAVQAVKVTTLTQPVALAARPGTPNAVFIAQKTGVVRRVNFTASSATLTPTIVLNVADRISTKDERGLVGLAFKGGTKLYASYVNKAGASVIAEYPFANGKADKTKERIVLTFPHPTTHHYAGQLNLGPDGLLYMSIGDGGKPGDPDGNAQNLGTLLGKIIRINPAPSGTKAYTIPADNPFVGTPGARAEIWHYGLRNPWRWSFDRTTGQQWIGDVGQYLYEEVDHIASGQKGTNFGWNKREALHPYEGGAKPPGAVDPEFEYNHDDGSCSVTGGYVYRGARIASLKMHYVYTDYCKGQLIAFTGASAGSQHLDLGIHIDSPVSFGEDGAGELWVLSIAGGVYRLLPA